MLREIKEEHLYSRLIGFTADQASVVAEIGTSEQEGTISDGGAGTSTITLSRPFGRAPVVVGGLVDAAIDGGYFILSAAPTVSTIQVQTNRATDGLTTDATYGCIALGWESPVTDRVAHAKLKAARKRARLIAVQIDTAGSGTVNLGKGEVASISRTGTGDVTITLARPFQTQDAIGTISYPVVAVGTVVSANPNRAVKMFSATASTIRFKVFSAGSVAADETFNAFILGWDTTETGVNSSSAVMTGQRKPRLVSGVITVAAGTPAASVNTTDFSVGDTGTGVITVTLTNKFERAPIVIASCNGNSRAVVNTVAADSFIIETGNAGGANADLSGDVHFMALGFDDTNDY